MNKQISTATGVVIILIFAILTTGVIFTFSGNFFACENDLLKNISGNNVYEDYKNNELEREIHSDEYCEEGLVPNTEGLPYSQARLEIISSGWSPVQTLDNEEPLGMERVFWNYDYKEVHSCAGTGISPCVFFFQDNCLNYLMVNTAGEESPEQGIYAIVSGVTILTEEEIMQYIN